MEKFRVEAFIKNLKDDFSEAQEVVNKVEKYDASYDFPNEDEPPTFDEIEMLYRETLESKIRSILVKLSFALERLGCPQTAGRMISEVMKHEKKFGQLHFEPSLDAYWSEAIQIENRYFNAIKSEYSDSGKSEFYYELITEILKSTPKLIFEEKLEPEKEKDVKDLIFKVISSASFDIVKEIPIPHHVKTYKPDFGVRSLELAIEYKFCDDEDELKQCLGGIFEDIHAYSGSKDWTKFIAILYCTNHFSSHTVIERESKIANIPENWIIIPVFGTGKRVKNKKKKTSGA